jgi:hypothetical protein
MHLHLTGELNMKRVYICKKEMERTKWVEIFFDDKKDFTALKKALKPFGWKPWGGPRSAINDTKSTLPDAFDNFDYENDNMDNIPKYWEEELMLEGTDLFGGWTVTEAQRNTRRLKKVLKDLGWEIWTWEKTFADMI